MPCFIEDDSSLENYKTIWDKDSADIKKMIASLSTTKPFWKPKLNLMVMKLQVFMIKNNF